MPTSEEKHNIVRQPGETCPLINSAVKNLEDALGYLQKPDTDAPEQMATDMGEVDWLVGQALAEVQTLRGENESIRNWGEEWKQRAIELEITEYNEGLDTAILLAREVVGSTDEGETLICGLESSKVKEPL